MKLHNKSARLLIPDGCTETEAWRRTTHIGIGAHQDDLELMALHGISSCYKRADKWFGGITCTTGGNSPKAGPYARYTEEEMREVRIGEQERAAKIGQYGFIAQLDYRSRGILGSDSPHLKEDLAKILHETRPTVVYTHNPADKHDTHVAVAVAVVQVLRDMAPGHVPDIVLGCEAWRGLDWLPDEDKVTLDVGGAKDLATALYTVYESQTTGGKRYDLAAPGRQRANATFLNPRAPDEMAMVAYAMDLTPLVKDPGMDIAEYTSALIARFNKDVRARLLRYRGEH